MSSCGFCYCRAELFLYGWLFSYRGGALVCEMHDMTQCFIMCSDKYIYILRIHNPVCIYSNKYPSIGNGPFARCLPYSSIYPRCEGDTEQHTHTHTRRDTHAKTSHVCVCVCACLLPSILYTSLHTSTPFGVYWRTRRGLDTQEEGRSIQMLFVFSVPFSFPFPSFFLRWSPHTRQRLSREGCGRPFPSRQICILTK